MTFGLGVNAGFGSNVIVFNYSNVDFGLILVNYRIELSLKGEVYALDFLLMSPLCIIMN